MHEVTKGSLGQIENFDLPQFRTSDTYEVVEARSDEKVDRRSEKHPEAPICLF